MSLRKIVVIGSCNVDISCRVHRLPTPGETVKAISMSQTFGGKGANQAVACSVLGSEVVFVGRVGCDADGVSVRENLQSVGIEAGPDFLMTSSLEPTGRAFIHVSDSDGENCIVIVSGGNGEVSASDIDHCLQRTGILSQSAFVVGQCEIPIEATLRAFQLASGMNQDQSTSILTVFSPAPAPEDGWFPDELWNHVDILIPNQHEARLLLRQMDLGEFSGRCVEELTVREMAVLLAERVRFAVVVTCGKEGCVVCKHGSAEAIPVSADLSLLPDNFEVCDTTGAGDCFVGSFLHFLRLDPRGDLVDASRRACVVAAYSVTRPGAQSSYHHPAELPSELFASH